MFVRKVFVLRWDNRVGSGGHEGRVDDVSGTVDGGGVGVGVVEEKWYWEGER